MSLESFIEEIPEAYYRKAIDLNRYSNSVARELMQSYERVVRRSIAELERIEKMPSAKRPQVRAQRLKALIKQNTEALANWSDKAGQKLASELSDLAKIEVDFTAGQLRRALPDVAQGAVRTVEVTPAFAEAVITADPTNVGTAVLSDNLEEIVSGPAKAMKLTARQGAAIRMPDGRSIGKAFRGLAEQQAQIFATTVQDGLLSGESTQSIARTLIGEGLEFSTKAKSIRQLAQAGGQMTKMATHQVRTLVRTSVNATSNVASQRVYKANPTVTKKYRWLATLDEKTSPICRSLDQQVFEYGKGPTPANPPHFNCRSSTVPVVDWDGLSNKYGIDLTPPRSRAKRPSASGGVPLGTSYGKWLHDQRPKGKKFEASAAQAKALNGGRDTPGARQKARYFNRLADKYGPDKAMKKFLRDDGTEVSLADLKKRYGEPEKITTTKVKAKPNALTKNEKIAKQVMQDSSLKSDKKRIEAMVEKGVPANADFVGLVAEAKKKSGLATTETFPKAKPKPKAAAKPKPAPKPKPANVDAELAEVSKELKALTPELLKAKPDPAVLKKSKDLVAKKNQLLADQASAKAKSGKVSDVLFEHQSKLYKQYGFDTEAAFDEAKQGINDWTNMAYGGLRNEQLSRVPTKDLTVYEIGKVERWNAKKKLGDVFYDYETLEKNLDTFVKNAPKYDGEVLRGNAVGSVSQAEAMIKAVANGRRTPTYDSWTTNPDQARNFFEDGEVGVLWKLNNKNGVPIAAHSKFKNESEVLMPRGNLYNVQSVKKTLVDGQTVFEVTLDQVSP